MTVPSFRAPEAGSGERTETVEESRNGAIGAGAGIEKSTYDIDIYEIPILDLGFIPLKVPPFSHCTYFTSLITDRVPGRFSIAIQRTQASNYFPDSSRVTCFAAVL